MAAGRQIRLACNKSLRPKRQDLNPPFTPNVVAYFTQATLGFAKAGQNLCSGAHRCAGSLVNRFTRLFNNSGGFCVRV